MRRQGRGAQLLCFSMFLLVLASTWHVLLLKEHQDAPQLLAGRLLVAFILAMVCRWLARRQAPDHRDLLDRIWAALGVPEMVLLGFLFVLL